MDARRFPAAILVACSLLLGADYRTENFIVTARSPELARTVADQAEQYRRELALEWLGAELPPWSDKCIVRAEAGPGLGAGGQTVFSFSNNGVPHSWSMSIRGSRERLLDSVLPHEITHTVFATHFGRPLPRWADEGACTTVEHISEKRRHQQMLIEFLMTDRGIAFNRMFQMRQYPADIFPLYAQGYSVARFLIQHGGKQKFVRYLEDGMRWDDWTRATRKHYDFESLSELQVTWLDWVRQGSPNLQHRTAETYLASETAAPRDSAEAPSAPRPDATRVPLAAPTPPAARAARNESGTSWYARVRDRAQSEKKAPTTGRATRQATGQRLGRPPEAQRPGQIVLEWSRAPSAARPARTILR